MENEHADQQKIKEIRLEIGSKSYLLSLPSLTDAYIDAIAKGGWRDSTWRFLMDWIRQGQVFFDLGANIGAFAIPAGVLGAKVHAFELLPENVAALMSSKRANHLDDFSVVMCALWDLPGAIGFGGFSAWGTVLSESPMAMATLRIDDYVSQHQVKRVDLMKIDIEGSEQRALKGAIQLLDRDSPDIIIKSNAVTCGNQGYSYKELLFF